MANISSHDEKDPGPVHGAPGMGGQPDDDPRGPTGVVGQGVIDDHGGGVGLPTEALRSPVGTPIGGPAGVKGDEAARESPGGDPG